MTANALAVADVDSPDDDTQPGPHGSAKFRKLAALAKTGYARAGQRYRFPNGRVLRVIRIRQNVMPDDEPALCRWEDTGKREDYGPWICNVAELLPDGAAS